MRPAYARSDTTTLTDFVEGVMLYPIGFVVCSTTFPGFLLCIPVITLVTAFALVPLIAVALVVLVAVGVVAAPVVLFRVTRAVVTRVAAALARPRTARDRAPALERRPLTELAPR
jgi:hypothetical protein